MGALEAGCNATAAKPVINMIFMRGIHFGRAFGKFDPVHAGHHDVGQQKIEAKAFQTFMRFLSVTEIGDLVARTHQRLRQKFTQQLVIFDQKDVRHTPSAQTN